jgi:hypothetical protein
MRNADIENDKARGDRQITAGFVFSQVLSRKP